MLIDPAHLTTNFQSCYSLLEFSPGVLTKRAVGPIPLMSALLPWPEVSNSNRRLSYKNCQTFKIAQHAMIAVCSDLFPQLCIFLSQVVIISWHLPLQRHHFILNCHLMIHNAWNIITREMGKRKGSNIDNLRKSISCLAAERLSLSITADSWISLSISVTRIKNIFAIEQKVLDVSIKKIGVSLTNWESNFC